MTFLVVTVNLQCTMSKKVCQVKNIIEEGLKLQSHNTLNKIFPVEVYCTYHKKAKLRNSPNVEPINWEYSIQFFTAQYSYKQSTHSIHVTYWFLSLPVRSNDLKLRAT